MTNQNQSIIIYNSNLNNIANNNFIIINIKPIMHYYLPGSCHNKSEHILPTQAIFPACLATPYLAFFSLQANKPSCSLQPMHHQNNMLQSKTCTHMPNSSTLIKAMYLSIPWTKHEPQFKQTNANISSYNRTWSVHTSKLQNHPSSVSCYTSHTTFNLEEEMDISLAMY